jgi:hypothetical protein
MADLPHTGIFGMKTIHGVGPRRQPVMGLGAPFHGMALTQHGAQHAWLAGALERLGATDPVLNVATVPRSKPAR